MKRRLILHLGLPKTGTTSIQNFLRSNPDRLAEEGVLYPKTGNGAAVHMPGGQSPLTAHFEREINHAALASEIRISRPGESAFDTETPLWSEVFRQSHKQKFDTTIISYEGFGADISRYRFDLLKENFSDFDVTILVFLRPQEDWIISLYGQMIRGKDRLSKPIQKFGPFCRVGDLLYSRKLDAILDQIACDNLVVLDFEVSANCGLLTTFCRHASLPSTLLTPSAEASSLNRSFPHWATLFLLACNQARVSDAMFLDVRRTLGRMAAGGQSVDLRPGLDMATPKQRQALRDVMAHDATRLRQRYGITLETTGREPIAYRRFDRVDFATVAAAIGPQLNPPTRGAFISAAACETPELVLKQ